VSEQPGLQALPGAVERFTDEMAGRKLKEAGGKLVQFFPKWIHEGNVAHVESIDLAPFLV
jgi:hypothetical protein